VESAFDLDRSGLRFVRAESEAAYRVWYVKRSAAFARMSMLAALATWGILLVVGPFLVSTRAYLEIAALFGVSALPAFLLALATARGDGSRWMLPAQMLANTASGLMFVCMSFGVLDRPDLAIIGVITAAFYGFTVQPLRVTQAARATLGYVAAHQVFAIL